MNATEVLALYDEHCRKSPRQRHGYLFDRDGEVWRTLGPSDQPADNGIRYTQLTDATADDAIARQLFYFNALRRGFEWKTYSHDEPKDLGERLRRAGMKAEDTETLVVLDLDGIVPADPEGSIRVRRIADPKEFAKLGELQNVVWGGDHQWLVDSLTRELAQTPDQLDVFYAEDGDKVVSTAWLRTEPGNPFASLWGGSTLVEYRGRGVYKSLVMARAVAAQVKGARYLTVDALPTSRPILERLGFVALTTTTPFVWTPS